MKNTFGNNLSVTIFGESHGDAIGVVLDGLKSGLKIDDDLIEHQLTLRRPYGKIGTSRIEKDEFKIVSGAFNGMTTGTPLTIIIPNSNTKSSDYSAMRSIARPSHADYTAYVRYNGFEDYRGGGHFSGRITAALVAGAAIVLPALYDEGIKIGTHIKSLGGVNDRDFGDLDKDIDLLNDELFAVLDKEAGSKMQDAIEKASLEGDSIGGHLESAITGLRPGIGEPFFDSLESLYAHGLFSVPGIKGVEFGNAFEDCLMHGSEFNDAFRVKDGKIVTVTNHNSGINGGISNGMPVIIKCAVKPTPSVYKTQKTVDFKENRDCDLNIEGRHDPAIIHRARVVVDSILAFVTYDVIN
ncbi:MAG: chorismate synthase [Lachnospiraceae bacterium]|nr:chorismate synthase [Lachnospiraceae bacterium]